MNDKMRMKYIGINSEKRSREEYEKKCSTAAEQQNDGNITKEIDAKQSTSKLNHQNKQKKRVNNRPAISVKTQSQ